jgi:phosphoenolpyruvate-protein kinase (PTS system EI component)
MTPKERKATNDRINDAISQLATEMHPLVKEIEASMMLTQNHYGKYMDVILTLGGDTKAQRQLIACGLKAAGANTNGVSDALKICLGE